MIETLTSDMTDRSTECARLKDDVTVREQQPLAPRHRRPEIIRVTFAQPTLRKARYMNALHSSIDRGHLIHNCASGIARSIVNRNNLNLLIVLIQKRLQTSP